MKNLLAKIDWDVVMLANLLLGITAFVVCFFISLEVVEDHETRYLWGTFSMFGMTWSAFSPFICMLLGEKFNK